MKGRVYSTMTIAGFSVTILAAASMLMAADGQQKKTFPTCKNPRVSLTNFIGSVSVQGWGKPEVQAVYRVAFTPGVEVDADDMALKGKAQKVHFETHLLNTQARGGNETVDYVLD